MKLGHSADEIKYLDTTGFIKAVAVVAMAVAAGAFAASGVAISRPVPAKPGPQGVCVLLSQASADTTVTADVTTPSIVNGVVTCESGAFISVEPK